MSPLTRALLAALAGAVVLQFGLGAVVAASSPSGIALAAAGLAVQAVTAALGAAVLLRSAPRVRRGRLAAAGLAVPVLLGLVSAAASAGAGAGPARIAVGLGATLLAAGIGTWLAGTLLDPADRPDPAAAYR